MIGGGGVDTVASREDDRVVIIVKLVGEKEGAGEAVVLRSVMAVVFVSRNGVEPEASVLVLMNRKLVTEAEEDWLAVAHHHEFRGNAFRCRSNLQKGSGRAGSGENAEGMGVAALMPEF